MIGDIFLQVLKVSVFAAIIIGALLAMMPVLRKRYHAKWRYAVWLVIAARLLLPVNITLPQAPINIELPNEIITLSNSISAEVESTVLNNSASGEPVVFTNQVAVPPVAGTLTPPAQPPIAALQPPPTHPPSLTIIEIAGIIWLNGAIAYLLVQLLMYQIFLYKLKTSKTQPVPAFIKETAWQIGVDTGVCNLPEPVITSAADAPVLIGVFRPRVLLPHGKYNAEEITFILRHELVHYRRKDMLYKFALMAASALHWFNPFVHLMAARASKDIELACDDDVIRSLSGDARAGYGDTILSALPKKGRLSPMFSTHFGSGMKNVKSRLNNLFDTAAKRRGTAALLAVAVCAVTAASFTAFGYAADTENTASTARTETAPSPARTETAPSPTNTPVPAVRLPALPYVMISGVHRGGNWAFTTNNLEEDWGKQTDREMERLDEAYEERKDYPSSENGFIITEILPKSEFSDVRRIEHLYRESEVFQEMSQMTDGVFVVEDDRIISEISETLTEDTIYRTAVMSETDDDLTLDIDFMMARGQMAVWLVDPDGELAYMGRLSSSFKGSPTVTGKEGLWSVIRVFQGVEDDTLDFGNDRQFYSVNGSVELKLRLAEDKNDVAPFTQPTQDDVAPSTQPTQDDVIPFTRPVSTESPVAIARPVATEPPAVTPIPVTSSAGADNNVLLERYYEGNLAANLNQFRSSFTALEGDTVKFSLDEDLWGMGLNKENITFQIDVGNGETVQTVTLSNSEPEKELILTKDGNYYVRLCNPNMQMVNYRINMFHCGPFRHMGMGHHNGMRMNGYRAFDRVGGSGYFESADDECIFRMANTGTWGDYIGRLLPDMSPDAVDTVVDIYLDRHLFPGMTTPQGAKYVYDTIAPALEYMTDMARDDALKRIEAYY